MHFVLAISTCIATVGEQYLIFVLLKQFSCFTICFICLLFKLRQNYMIALKYPVSLTNSLFYSLGAKVTQYQLTMLTVFSKTFKCNM